MSYPRLCCAALCLFVNLASSDLWAAALDTVSLLKTLDAPHQPCEQPADLSVSRDFIVPIANDLPGVREYNRITQLNADKKWPELESEVAKFRRQFESSPLQEAVTFIMVNAAFERNPDPKSDGLKEAEKSLREALLLYPKSELIPIVSATVANYWLKTKNFEKSLSLYQTARDNYPFHELACVFQLGIGENRFFLRESKGAEASFQQILQKCKNRRVLTGAEIRLLEMKNAGTDKKFDDLYQTSAAHIDHYFPAALYNYGERKYQNKEFARAKYYFSQFLKSAPAGADCTISASKRLADVAFRSGEKLSQVVGLYLDVHEKASGTGPGLYAKVHALLLELPSVSEAEYQRRIRWMDESIDQIQDESLRGLAYLEKGVVLLGMGDERAVGYLVRLNDKLNFNMNQGAVAAYLRENLLKLLEKKSLATANSIEEARALDDLEQAFNLWLKGTAWANRGKQLYGKVMLARLEAAAENADAEHASDLLKRWKLSGLVDPARMELSSKKKVVGSLLRSLFESETPATVSTTYLKNEEVLKGFVEPYGNSFWTAVAVEAGDDERLKRLSQDRKPLSVDTQLPDELKDYLRLVTARAMMRNKRVKEAESALLAVKDETLKEKAQRLRFQLYRDNKQFLKAYDVGANLLKSASKEKKKEELSILYQLTSDGKVWNKAADLLGHAKELGLEGKEMAPYQFLSGRAYFEKKECRKAIEQYEHGLLSDNSAPESAEARYRMGKCLVAVKKPTQAKKIWEDLIQMQDSFWSPLAKNEIRLINP